MVRFGHHKVLRHFWVCEGRGSGCAVWWWCARGVPKGDRDRLDCAKAMISGTRCLLPEKTGEEVCGFWFGWSP